MLIDTHAHLDDQKFAGDLNEVLERATEADVRHIITVGTDLENSRTAVALADKYPMVSASVGVHPHDADTADDAALAALRELAAQAKVVAIGETGLDYYRDLSPRPMQQQAFRRQIDLALKCGLPLIVHTRDASEDCLSILESCRDSGLRGVAHCFSADVSVLARFLALGFHISFTGNVTYPKNQALKEVARRVPPDRLMVETDCPYMAPQPVRGKRNEPAYVRYTLHELAGLLGVAGPDLAEITSRNARELFGIEQT